jgi:hypothetical protein
MILTSLSTQNRLLRIFISSHNCLHHPISPITPIPARLAKFCSVLFTNLTNKLYFYKFYILFYPYYLSAPDSSGSGGEGGGCGCACEEATGRKPPQPLQPPANRCRPIANGRMRRKKLPLRFTMVAGMTTIQR